MSEKKRKVSLLLQRTLFVNDKYNSFYHCPRKKCGYKIINFEGIKTNTKNLTRDS